MLDSYRLNAFTREHDILQTLLNKERCLQLESALNTYQLTLNLPGHVGFTLPCQYFVVEWIDNDIDDYFFLGKNCETIDKLKLFNEIVLAVEALHRHEVFHRDIKSDNLRAYKKALMRIVVAIDLGTAARISSGYIQDSYKHSVGAPGYASPEALCGLAAHRVLAPYTDRYALGCLLYELFNNDYFYRANRIRNPHFDLYLNAMASTVVGVKTEDEQLKKWKTSLNTYRGCSYAIEINNAGSDIPKGIEYILNNLLNKLTSFDYSKRPKLDCVRNTIWTAIRVMENQKHCQRKARIARERRLKRKENIKLKEIKLRKYLDVVHRVNDSVIAIPYPIGMVCPAQFFAARRIRIIDKAFNSLTNGLHGCSG